MLFRDCREYILCFGEYILLSTGILMEIANK